MPKNKNLKKRIRALMAQKGISYTKAREIILAKQKEK